jgi:phosphate transport system permease protein
MSKYNIRKIIDFIQQGSTYFLGSIGAVILAVIIWYVFTTGSHLVTIDTIISDAQDYDTVVFVNDGPGDYELLNYNFDEELFYSTKWGLGFINGFDREGNDQVFVNYIHPDSPFLNALDLNNVDEDGNYNDIRVNRGTTVLTVFFDNGIAIARFGAESVKDGFESANKVESLSLRLRGGGIRGSFITTIYLIILTLLIAVPIGVTTAVYLNEFAPKGKRSSIIRSMIDLLTGVPSIIYGLLGAALFIPILNATTLTSGGSVLSGALTLAVILLPVIIKSTEEALKVIDDDLRRGSLALGASKTQTVFKVIIPNAVPGILTGVLLGVGRIVGESAALIYAIGASIKDEIILTERSTSLAVHIWTVMSSDAPNFELASAIAIIILGVVFSMNLLIKLITRSIYKKPM